MGLLGTLIIYATIPPITFYICVCNSWRKYTVFMMTAIMKIFYGLEKILTVAVKVSTVFLNLYSAKRKDRRKH